MLMGVGRLASCVLERNGISVHAQFMSGAEWGSLGTRRKDKEMIVGRLSDVCLYI